MDTDTHPWICRECTAVEKVFRDILKASSSHLYLLWFLNPSDTSAPIDEMETQWKTMHTAYNSSTPDLKHLIPLCAFTDAESKVRDLIDKDNKWHQCTTSQVFPKPTSALLPYGLWCLSVGAPIPSHDDMTNRFCLNKGVVSSLSVGKADLSNVNDALRHSVLAQALALQWLAQNKAEETMNALNAAIK